MILVVSWMSRMTILVCVVRWVRTSIHPMHARPTTCQMDNFG